MDSEERKDLISELRNIIEQMNQELDAVIIEGKHDREALRKLGFEKKILKASIFSSDNLIDSRVSVLTDFDSEGNKLRKRILERISRKAKVKNKYRKEIGKILGLLGEEISNQSTI